MRKLEDILQELKQLAEQGDVEGFFDNAENAAKLSRLVGAIRDAAMDYQVCDQSKLIVLTFDICLRLLYNKTSMKKVASSL